MLIITGMGRSGTSVLAEFCRLVGYDPGGERLGGEYNNGNEYSMVKEINDGLHNGTCFSAMKIDKKVIKDPRIFLFNTISLWHEFNKGIFLLVLLREYDNFKQSLNKWKVAKVQEDFLDSGLKNMLNFFVDVTKLNIPYRILVYPDFLTDFDLVYSVLSEFGIRFDFDEGLRIWEDLIDLNKVTR